MSIFNANNFFDKNRNVIFELSRKQIKKQYRGSFLGLVWTILNPLLNMLVMWLVFSTIFGRNDPYYPLYLLCGNIVFATLRASTSQALQSLVVNRGLLSRTKIDQYVFPCSNAVASMVTFAFSLIALVPFMLWLSIQQGVNLFSYQLLFIFLMVPALWLFEMGLGLILSAVYVFFRDLKHLYGVLLTLWQYLTPLFYKPSTIKDPFVTTVIKINPMYHFITYFRQCTYMCAARDVVVNPGVIDEVIGSVPQWTTLGWLYVAGVGMMIIGVIVFKSLKKNVIMHL